jgi:DNA mismatch repair protein MutS2
MARAGMHIPANPGATLSCFERVVADIGDEQSIEQSLSTFSSHLTNIIGFLPQADHRTLVLLDELGAGTDPAEGAALAHALLDTFRQQRCTAFVATHYPELKLYAHGTPGVRNASMAFDVETLAPTFHLTIGLPGRSNAFAIARRLGLPEGIIKDARQLVSREDLRADDMLEDLHNLRLQEVQARDAARRAHREADALTSELRERLADIETERREVLREAREEAQASIDALQREIHALRQRMLTTPMRPDDAELEAVQEDAEALEERIPEPEPLLASLTAEAEGEVETRGPIEVGDTVRVPALNAQGTVLEIEDDEAVVQVGALRTRVDLDELELIQRSRPPVPEDQQVSVPARPQSPGVQIDLRGQRVAEALDRLDRYLDEASMAALPWVRVVHGKGTGTLRREVRHFMADHPLVTSYETPPPREGGDGATVAHLVQAR